MNEVKHPKTKVAIFEDQPWTDRTKPRPKAERVDTFEVDVPAVNLRSMSNFNRAKQLATEELGKLGYHIRSVSLIADQAVGFHVVVYIHNRGALKRVGEAKRRKRPVKRTLVKR